VDSGDLSGNLGLGSLTPASSVGAVDGKPAHPDAETQARRRSRMEREKIQERKLESDSENDGDSNSNNQDQPETASPVHQLDHLA
jgi:hypothetical protein